MDEAGNRGSNRAIKQIQKASEGLYAANVEIFKLSNRTALGAGKEEDIEIFTYV